MGSGGTSSPRHLGLDETSLWVQDLYVVNEKRQQEWVDWRNHTSHLPPLKRSPAKDNLALGRTIFSTEPHTLQESQGQLQPWGFCCSMAPRGCLGPELAWRHRVSMYMALAPHRLQEDLPGFGNGTCSLLCEGMG